MGYPSVAALLEAIPDVVRVLGKHRAKRVCLHGVDPGVSGSGDGSSSFEESYNRSYSSSSNRSRNGDMYQSQTGPFSSHKDPNGRMTNNNYNTRCHSAEQFRPYNNHLKMGESGRWSESPKRHRAPPPPPLYLSSGMGTPAFTPRGQAGPDVFTFDQRPPQLSPLVSNSYLACYFVPDQ